MWFISAIILFNSLVIFPMSHGTDFTDFTRWQKKKITDVLATLEYIRRILGPKRNSSQQPLDGVWQPVDGTTSGFYVYSAYMDTRLNPPALRIIAAARTHAADAVYCRLRLKNNMSYALVAEVKTICESHEFFYSAVFLTCLTHPLKPEDVIGGEISIVSTSKPEELATNLLEVKDITAKPWDDEQNVHVCVRPFHNQYNDVEWMVEWIEFNRLLGVSHFYFYNMSIGSRFDCMLHNYPNKEEIFTVLPFDLPLPKPGLWMDGQQASSHDCLYRSMSKANWLMIMDADELVLPHDEGIEKLESFDGLWNGKPFPALFNMPNIVNKDVKINVPHDALVFRNAFFYRGWKDDPKSTVPLVTSLKTGRTTFVNKHGDRSKFAVQPTKIAELSIHMVEKYHDKKHSGGHLVPEEIALLHHYRNECINGCYVGAVIRFRDRAAHRWSEQLWARVQPIMAEIEQICPKQ